MQPINPIDVGDSKEILSNINNCKVFNNYNYEIDDFIKSIIKNDLFSDARSTIKFLSLNKVATKIVNLYNNYK